MPISLIPSFLFYCFIGGITPGPANLCSLNASLRYGKTQALKQWRGLFTGYWIVSMGAVLVSYFLGGVLGDSVKWLAYIGAAYLCFLAVKVLLPSKESAASPDRDCNFLTGLVVQLTNVKIMMSCLTELSAYVLPYTRSFWVLLLVGCFLPFTGPMCNLVWLFAGDALRRFFLKYNKLINILMAIALVLCAVSLIRAV